MNNNTFDIGNFRVLEVYIEWNGPRLYSCIDDMSRLVLVSWIEDKGLASRWWYVPISKRRLEDVRRGVVDISSAIRLPEGALYVATATGERIEFCSVRLAEVDPSDFPLPGDRLALTSRLSAIIGESERQHVSKATGAEILDIGLVGNSVDDHMIGFDSLRKMLQRWSDFLDEVARSLGGSFSGRVCALAPGSFVIRVAGHDDSLRGVTMALQELSAGDIELGVRRSLRTSKLRSSFATLLDGAIDENLSMAIAWTSPQGGSTTGWIPVDRGRELRDQLRRTSVVNTEIILKGTLETASLSKKQLVLLTQDRTAAQVDVPRELVSTIKGRRIGAEYELPVTKTTISNFFGDEIEVAYQLRDIEGDVFGVSERTSPGKEAGQSFRATQRTDPVVQGEVVRRWAKQMSATDAQKTASASVPYLRLTESRNGLADSARWFREELFGSAVEWIQERWGRSRSVCDVADVDFIVKWPNERPTLCRMMVTHDLVRRHANAQPATWVHWSDSILRHLRDSNLSGWWVAITRDEYGTMAISFDEKRPRWFGLPQPEKAGER